MPSYIQSTASLYSLLLAAAFTSHVSAQDKVTYQDHILPILENSCTNCHNPDKKKGGLDLTSYTAAMAGGSGGKIADPGEGASSRIFLTTTHTAEPFMPPKGDKLGKKETDLIRAWIDGGLLETKDSKAKKSDTPKITFSDVTMGKPEGPPPVPEHVLLEPVVTPQHATVVRDMKASPWAPILAVTSQSQVLLYNTDSLELAGVLPYPSGHPDSLSFHPSGKFLTVGGGIAGKSGTTITYDITTGAQVMQIAKEYDSVIASSLRPDMKAIATGGPSRLIKIWQTESNTQEHSIKKHTDWITHLSYSRDGILLASADRNGGLWVWEAYSGNLLHTLRGHQARITSLQWSADSNFLASASEDGTLLFWDMRSGKQVKKLDAHRDGVLDFDWSKDGKILTTGRDHFVKLWKPDYNPLKQVEVKEKLYTAAVFSHDAKRFFTADYSGQITAWDSESQKEIGVMSSTPPSIDRRVQQAQELISQLPELIKSAEAKHRDIEKKLADGKAKVEQTKAQLAKDQAEEQQLKKQINQTKEQLKDLNENISKLEDQRKQLQQLRKANRDSVNEHRGMVHNSRKELESLKKDSQQSNKSIANLKRELTALQEASAKAPEDTQLLEKLSAHEAKVKQSEQELTELNERLSSAQASYDQLQKQAQELETASKESESKWQATVPSWEKLTKGRSDLYSELKVANEKLPKLYKAMDQARKTMPAIEKNIQSWAAEARQAADSLSREKAEMARLQSRVHALLAASINTKRLKAKTHLEELQSQRKTLLDQFSTLAKAGQQSSGEIIRMKEQLDLLAVSCHRAEKSFGRLNEEYFAALKQPD